MCANSSAGADISPPPPPGGWGAAHPPPVGEGKKKPLKGFDALAVHVDVDVVVHLALFVPHETLEAAEVGLEPVQEPPDVGGLDPALVLVVRRPSEGLRDVDLHCHAGDLRVAKGAGSGIARRCREARSRPPARERGAPLPGTPRRRPAPPRFPPEALPRASAARRWPWRPRPSPG